MTESENQTVQGAISGDTQAVQQLINQIISTDQETQSAGLGDIQSSEQRALWNGLLTLLAEGRWPGGPGAMVHPGSEEHQRLSLKISYLFGYDLTPAVSGVKEQALLAGLKSETPAIRAASAELLGSRGTRQASTNLVEALHDPDANVRWHAAQALCQIADPASIEPLVACLSEPNPALIHQVRLALVTIGRPAVPALVKALSSSSDQVRWEAAKALCQINDPEAAPALLTALEDNNAGVRWLAAEGLINLKREGLEPLLHMLVRHKYSTWLGRSAHHVLQELRKRKEFEAVAAPVLNALESLEPAAAVPAAALAALDLLGRSGNG